MCQYTYVISSYYTVCVVRKCVCACTVSYRHPLPFPPVAVVDYVNSSVAVMEGDSVDICVQLEIELTTPLGRDVLVTLNLQDINTTG